MRFLYILAYNGIVRKLDTIDSQEQVTDVLCLFANMELDGCNFASEEKITEIKTYLRLKFPEWYEKAAWTASRIGVG